MKWIQSEAQVTLVANELADARKAATEGQATEGEAYVRAIHDRFT